MGENQNQTQSQKQVQSPTQKLTQRHKWLLCSQEEEIFNTMTGSWQLLLLLQSQMTLEMIEGCFGEVMEVMGVMEVGGDVHMEDTEVDMACMDSQATICFK